MEVRESEHNTGVIILTEFLDQLRVQDAHSLAQVAKWAQTHTKDVLPVLGGLLTEMSRLHLQAISQKVCHSYLYLTVLKTKCYIEQCDTGGTQKHDRGCSSPVFSRLSVSTVRKSSAPRVRKFSFSRSCA